MTSEQANLSSKPNLFPTTEFMKDWTKMDMGHLTRDDMRRNFKAGKIQRGRDGLHGFSNEAGAMSANTYTASQLNWIHTGWAFDVVAVREIK